jgi:hypothetical protein
VRESVKAEVLKFVLGLALLLLLAYLMAKGLE